MTRAGTVGSPRAAEPHRDTPSTCARDRHRSNTEADRAGAVPCPAKGRHRPAAVLRRVVRRGAVNRPMRPGCRSGRRPPRADGRAGGGGRASAQRRSSRRRVQSCVRAAGRKRAPWTRVERRIGMARWPASRCGSGAWTSGAHERPLALRWRGCRRPVGLPGAHGVPRETSGRRPEWDV